MAFFYVAKAHRYAGKQRKVGDAYEVKREADARLIRALGWVIPMPPTPVDEVPKMNNYRAAVQVAEPAYLPSVQAEKPKRTYRRRDMAAKFSAAE
jgi:hypothetical protein